MYKLIYCTKNFEHNGELLPQLPFILNEEGLPLDEVNDYFLYLATDKHRDLSTTVRKSAYSVLFVLNFLKDLDNIEWYQVKESHLKMLINRLNQEGATKKQILLQDTINGYPSAFVQFLWWCEKIAGFCNGVVGINDISINKVRYRVPLSPSSEKGKEYKIPWLLKSKKKVVRAKGGRHDWDQALEQTINHEVDSANLKAVAKKHRDEMILRLLSEAALRRTELVHLDVSQFSEYLRGGELRAWIVLKKTKIHETREVGIFEDLYYDIKDYIETSRKEIVRGKVHSDALFPSMQTGSYLHLNSVNTLLKGKYGVRPQDGRSLALTERFVDLIKDGMDQNEAILIVGEEAGHSIKSEGKTLVKHYLRAKEIVSKGDVMPRSSLDAENKRLKLELEEVKTKLADAGIL